MEFPCVLKTLIIEYLTLIEQLSAGHIPNRHYLKSIAEVDRRITKDEYIEISSSEEGWNLLHARCLLKYHVKAFPHCQTFYLNLPQWLREICVVTLTQIDRCWGYWLQSQACIFGQALACDIFRWVTQTAPPTKEEIRYLRQGDIKHLIECQDPELIEYMIKIGVTVDIMTLFEVCDVNFDPTVMKLLVRSIVTSESPFDINDMLWLYMRGDPDLVNLVWSLILQCPHTPRELYELLDENALPTEEILNILLAED